MNKPDDIPKRVNRLEREVAVARADAAAARILAGGADRDVSAMHAELRAHTKSLETLRETQVEDGQSLGRLEGKVDEGFLQANQNFETISAHFGEVGAGMSKITDLLTAALRTTDET